MKRRLARIVLTLVLAVSVASSVWAGWRLATGWPGSAVVERGTEEIAAAMERAMAREATPQRLSERLEEFLAEEDRNWTEIDAVMAVAAERGVALPPETIAAVGTARKEDTGQLAFAGDCLACAWDPAECGLDFSLVCQAPIALSPLGDIGGIALELGRFAKGEELDKINLGLSIVGLGATVMVIPSGGSAAPLAGGAKGLKAAYRMGRLSPQLTKKLGHALEKGIDWTAVRALRLSDFRQPSDLGKLVRMDAVGPVIDISTDMGRVADHAGLSTAWILLPKIDDATEARRMAVAAEALDSRTLGNFEILGKSRFLKATLRWSHLVWELVAGVIGALAALVGLVANTIGDIVLRRLRRIAR